MNKIHKMIRRVTIYGENKEKEKAYEWLEDRAYKIVISRLTGLRDLSFTRFRIVAERDITHEFDEY